MNALLDGPGWRMRQAVQNGECSALELVEAQLQRIHQQADLLAFTAVTGQRALDAARALDAGRRPGDVLAPLDAVTVSVKNLFDVAGLATLAGADARLAQAPATRDAALPAALAAAGAIVVGTVNMDEFAYGFTTENSHYGTTRNPHAAGRLCGGSSGGSGAAVAAGLSAISLASDTNGSIRVPASLCGTFGLKATFGALSRAGSVPFVHSLDHVGPLARSVRDLALAFDHGLAAAGPGHEVDPVCRSFKARPCTPSLEQGLGGLRIARLGGYFDNWARPEAQAAAGMVADALGVRHTVQWPEVELARAAAFLITATEGGQQHLGHLREHYELLEPLSRDRFLAGALTPAAWYVQAQRFRRWFRDRIRQQFAEFDLFIAPATPCSAPLAGEEWLDLPGGRLPLRPALGLLTQPLSCIGLPVVVVPCSDASGLPLGVQIIAAPWREDLALRAAQVLESSGACRARTPDRLMPVKECG